MRDGRNRERGSGMEEEETGAIHSHLLVGISEKVVVEREEGRGILYRGMEWGATSIRGGVGGGGRVEGRKGNKE